MDLVVDQRRLNLYSNCEGFLIGVAVSSLQARGAFEKVVSAVGGRHCIEGDVVLNPVELAKAYKVGLLSGDSSIVSTVSECFNDEGIIAPDIPRGEKAVEECIRIGFITPANG